MNTVARQTNIQQRTSTLPAHLSLFRQTYAVTKRDKRYYVYGWCCGCLLLLILLKYWLEPEPQSNVFAWCLLGCVGLCGYAYLATFYQQVSTEFFLIAATLILFAPVGFLGIALWDRHAQQQERKSAEMIVLLRTLKQQIETAPLDAVRSETLRPLLHHPAIYRLSVTTPTRVILTCNRVTCQVFDRGRSDAYKTAEQLCASAAYRIPLYAAQEVIGQLCVSVL